MSVLMHGPAFTETGELVERAVPENDVEAYLAAGYKHGPLPTAKAEAAPDVVAPETPDLRSLTKVELEGMAVERGLEVTGMKKGEIIELLSAD